MASSLLIRSFLVVTISALPCLGYFDCEDGPGSNQHCVLQIDSDYFQCDDGSCVCRASRCDGNPDCLDSSDETAVECDAILAGVIGGVAGLALLCCVGPCLCCLCYCLCRRCCCRKKSEAALVEEKIFADVTPSQCGVSAKNHVSLSGQRSSEIRADLAIPPPVVGGTSTDV